MCAEIWIEFTLKNFTVSIYINLNLIDKKID